MSKTENEKRLKQALETFQAELQHFKKEQRYTRLKGQLQKVEQGLKPLAKTLRAKEGKFKLESDGSAKPMPQPKPEPEALPNDDLIVLADNAETPAAKREAAKKRPGRKRGRKAKGRNISSKDSPDE